MMEYNYEFDLRIDESALDVEWVEQPILMMKYGRLFAEARKELDRVKEKLGVVRAEVDKDIRSRPEKYGVEKITEAAVQNAILATKAYKDVMVEMIDSQYEVEMTRAALSAVEHRKQALENLSRLLGLQYFAGPRTPRDLPKEIQQRQSENIKEIQQAHADEVVTIPRRRRK